MRSLVLSVFFSFCSTSLAVQNPAPATTSRTSVPYEEVEVIQAEPVDFYSSRSSDWVFSELNENDLTQVESIYESLEKIPGVQSRDQGAPAVSIRGSVAAGRVLTLYNGTPLNTADGFGAPDLLVPKEAIQRSLLIKGPASAFFGSAAMAGAINHITPAGTPSRVELQGSSIGAAGALLGLRLANSNKNKISASAFFEGGPRQFYFQNSQTGDINLRSDNQRYLERVVINGQHKLKNLEVREDIVVGHDQGTTPGSITEPQVTNFENLAGLASLSLRLGLGEGWHLQSKSSAIAHDSSFDDVDGDLPDTSSLSQKFHQSFSVRKDFTNGMSFEPFFDYTYQQLDSSAASELLWESQNEYGLLGRVPLSDEIILQAGARYLANESLYIPSLGLTYMGEHWHSWATYSEGFRQPSLNDRYADFPTFVGNPDLQPEKSRQIELGLSNEHLFGFQWKLVGFATEYSNFIQFFSVSEQSSTMRNVGSAQVAGGELTTGWRLKSWQFLASGVYTYARDASTNSDLLLTPTVEGSLLARKEFKKLAFSSRLTYWGEMLDEVKGEQVVLDDGFGLDFEAQFKLKTWLVSAAFLNSLDQPREMKFGFPQPQRRIVGKLTHFF